MSAELRGEDRVRAERKAKRRAAVKVAFAVHASVYLVVNGFLALINLITWSGYFWAIWPMLGWGVGLGIHFLAGHIIPIYARRFYREEFARIRKDYEEVTERNIDLETLVRERTKALEEANAQLAASNDKLKELDRLKTEFLSNVSHEFRTPLTAIKGAVDNMVDGITGDLEPKQKDYLVRMGSNVKRLTRLINDMLDLARIESGRVTIEMQPVDLCALVRETVEELRPVAEERGVKIGIRAEISPLTVDAERDKVQQVLTNLLGNAIKFTDRDGSVEIRIDNHGRGYAKVVVRDTGCGIPADELEAVFDRFHQARQQLRSKSKGSGLGLSIAKSLIEMHGGEIWVESDRGDGAEFTFTLRKIESGGRP